MIIIVNICFDAVKLAECLIHHTLPRNNLPQAVSATGMWRRRLEFTNTRGLVPKT
jgi:hypothetical protein